MPEPASPSVPSCVLLRCTHWISDLSIFGVNGDTPDVSRRYGTWFLLLPFAFSVPDHRQLGSTRSSYFRCSNSSGCCITVALGAAARQGSPPHRYTHRASPPSTTLPTPCDRVPVSRFVLLTSIRSSNSLIYLLHKREPVQYEIYDTLHRRCCLTQPFQLPLSTRQPSRKGSEHIRSQDCIPASPSTRCSFHTILCATSHQQ